MNEIYENSDLINEQYEINKSLSSQEPLLFTNHYEGLRDHIYLNNHKEKRTDRERLRNHGIDTLDRLLEECIKVSNKQSKLPKSIRDLVLKYSLEAYKELQSKAKEIEKNRYKIINKKMTEKNSKVGLMTKDEAQFFGKLVAGEIPVNRVYKSALNFALPALLNGLDDKIGDKLPEPWQTYTEDFITAIYEALQDKVLSDEEITAITEKVAAILSIEIHVPLIDEAMELEAFQYLLKYMAATIKNMITKKA